MKKKINGFLLFEFLISSLLASTLIIIIYQSYKTTNTGVQYIKNNADFEIQKLLLIYHMELDAMHIMIPDFIYELYPKIKNYFNKNNQNTNEKNNKNDENDENKKMLTKDFALGSIFFPELINTPEEIKISWISSRKVLHKNALVKINYIFRSTNTEYKNKKLYKLYRREDALDEDYSITTNGTEYIFITYILDPEISFIMPKIIDNESDNTDKNNKYIEWKSQQTFINKNSLKKIDFNNMHKEAFMPFSLLINGIILPYNLSKELPLNVIINFPIADYALQILLYTEKNSDSQNSSPIKNNPINNNIKNNSTELNSTNVINIMKEENNFYTI